MRESSYGDPHGRFEGDYYWSAVKELELSYSNKEALFSTMYTYHGNFI